MTVVDPPPLIEHIVCFCVCGVAVAVGGDVGSDVGEEVGALTGVIYLGAQMREFTAVVEEDFAVAG